METKSERLAVIERKKETSRKRPLVVSHYVFITGQGRKEVNLKNRDLGPRYKMQI